ncbi:MAG: ATP phosphoribosyltransferase [Crenarchaeota archaeon]|nr:ATP phosphoribosyltransferase [Thermoproteota archaeon]MDW8033498.1 ATP phosphoribosyltransferase [Nitrososphaerota archaeon]
MCFKECVAELSSSTVFIALPSKGRLFQPSIDLMTSAGLIHYFSNDRSYQACSRMKDLRIVFNRAADIPRIVEKGVVDLGITGRDLVKESNADVEELLPLNYGHARLVLAAPASKFKELKDLLNMGRIKVATEFPNITKSFFKEMNADVEIIGVEGTTESMPNLGLSDCIVSVMSTGSTLLLHGLKILAVVMESQAVLIGNKKSLENVEKQPVINYVKSIIGATQLAQGKKLLMMNVPEERLKDVISCLPCMSGPTISRVEAKEPMWEVITVVDANKVFEVIYNVKEKGAKDILVLNIDKVIL